jgi:hypothetical protein
MPSIVEDAVYETLLNQVKHEFEIYLDSGGGDSDQRIHPINPNSIVNLTIEDSLANWVVKGSLTIFHNPEIQDEVFNTLLGNYSDSAETRNSLQDRSSYTFRNDGYDLLRIRIKPNLKDSTFTGNKLGITDPVHWTISHLFSIYDAEDIDLPPGAQNQASSTIKCLKLYFWDSWYQKMLSRILSYSTARSSNANIESDIQEGIVDNFGTIYTGDAMKEVIGLALSKDGVQVDGASVSLNVDPVLKVPYEPIKNSDWDTGMSKIFYTAPTDATAFDTLDYLEKKHVSSEKIDSASGQLDLSTEQAITRNDVSLLLKERGPNELDVGQFVLRPFSKFFEKAGKDTLVPGEYQIEHFFVQGYGGEARATAMLKAPINQGNNDKVDFSSPKFSTITSYRFIDMSALTNTENFTNKPVHSFNFKKRTFNIEFQNNSVKNARQFINEKYIKPLYKKGSPDNDRLFLITLNKDKEKLNTRPTFSLYGDLPLLRQTEGLHKLLRTGVFFNTAVNFRVLGLTNREPGRFIAIDKTSGAESGDFEDKFYGQWFVINVRHIIESEIYYNDITAVKIHRFQPLANNFPGSTII